MNGIIIVNKPVGYTSRDVVNIIGKQLKTKKVGHTGTLDPLASGVLVVTVGRYTKLGDILTSLDKEYIAEIKLGIKTDTLDITGKVLEEKSFNVNKDDLEKTLTSFIGKYKMEVPKYSAIKVNGKKLYEYARNNIDVELPIKEVEIKSIELLEYKDDIIKFKTKVEKGTYIRSLIRDICNNLNIIGTMNTLKRTKQGNFKIEDSYTIEEIKNNNFKILNIKDVLDIKEYSLNDIEYQKVINGNSIKLDIDNEYLLLTYNKEEIAIYQKENDLYKSYVMLKIK